MKKYSFLLGICFIAITIGCTPKHFFNKTIAETSTKESINPASLVFPQDWLGKWTGVLSISNHTGRTQTIHMELIVSTTDTSGLYDWVIIYGEDSTKQVRNYQLITIDESEKHYAIDEKNGIVIDAFFIENELKSIFEVSSNMLSISYKRKGVHMIFSVEMYPSKAIRTSGDTLINAVQIPKVTSFKYAIKQEAILQKKCLVK